MRGSLDSRAGYGAPLGVPASSLSWLRFSEKSPWNRGLGDAVWVTPLLPEYEKGTAPLVPAWQRVQSSVPARMPTVATFGGSSLFGKPLDFDERTPGVQGTFLSPGWFADLFTVSPREKEARAKEKAARQRERDARVAERRGDKQEARMYRLESQRLKQEAAATRKLTKTETAAAIRLKRSEDRSKKFDVGAALETGAGMVTDIFGNQTPAQTDVIGGGAPLPTVTAEDTGSTVPTGVWYALGAMAVAGVGYAVYKRVK